MGVEYMHYFIVKDPSWVGSTGEALRVHELLSRWNLVDDDPVVFNLDGRRARRLRGRLAGRREAPANFALEYPGVDGRETIAEIIGPPWRVDADVVMLEGLGW